MSVVPHTARLVSFLTNGQSGITMWRHNMATISEIKDFRTQSEMFAVYFIWAQTANKWTNACYKILIYTNWFDLYKLYRQGRLFRSLQHCHQWSYRRLCLSKTILWFTIFPISYRNFRNFDREKLRNEMSQKDWSFDESEDPNLLWSDWKTKLSKSKSNRSDEGLTLETSAFLPFTVANLRFQPSC